MATRLTEEQLRRLLGVLSGGAGAAVEFGAVPRRFSGATFSDVYGFRLHRAPPSWSRPLVLRVLPPSVPSGQASLEQAVQNAAADQGLPAPRVLLRHDEPDVVGAPFLVMERRPGRPVLAGKRPDLFVRDFPRVLWNWPAHFAATLGRLQEVDADRVLAATAAAGVDPSYADSGRHLDYVLQRLAGYADDGLGDVLAWLVTHRPAPAARPVLVHGDLWPANVLRRRGELSGLVDWNRTAIGHPALDVGFAAEAFALMPEPFPPPPPIGPALRAAGGSLANRICRSVEVDAEAVRYFRALRCLLELAGAAAQAGVTTPEPTSVWARSTHRLITRARALTGIPVHLPAALGQQQSSTP